MKTIKVFMIFSIVVSILMWFCVGTAEQNVIILPKGTKVEKLGQGHFRFIPPIVELKNFNPKTGAVSYVSIIDPQPPGKPFATGKQGVFKTNKKLTVEEAAKLQSKDYIMIDDDPTWLPATISFQPVAFGDPDPPPRAIAKGETKELSPQPDPPGIR